MSLFKQFVILSMWCHVMCAHDDIAIKEEVIETHSLKNEITDLLRAEISQKVTLQDFDIVTDNWTNSWEKDQINPLKINKLSITHNQTRFNAQIDGFKLPKRLFGKIVWYMEVPVLNRTIQPGEEIQAEDIHIEKMESHKMTNHHITSAEQLVGMICRHSMLRPGIPITKSYVMEPKIVKRGSVIRVIYKKGGLQVTNKGIALQDGSRSATIPIEMIQNGIPAKNKKVVYATILSSDNAELKV